MRTHSVIVLLTALAGLALQGCGSVNVEKVREPTADQLARKQRSEAQLQSDNIPFSAETPVIAAESDVQLRSETDVENRVLCLLTLAVKAEGLNQKLVDDIIGKYGLEPYFSPQETKFLAEDNASDFDSKIAKLRYESAWTLLWALGFVDSLSRPDQVAEVPAMVRIITQRSPDVFREDATLRSVAEILDEADLIYRYHRALHAAIDANKVMRVRLNDAVVYERHYALNWLIRYKDQDWDDVSIEEQSTE